MPIMLAPVGQKVKIVAMSLDAEVKRGSDLQFGRQPGLGRLGSARGAEQGRGDEDPRSVNASLSSERGNRGRQDRSRASADGCGNRGKRQRNVRAAPHIVRARKPRAAKSQWSKRGRVRQPREKRQNATQEPLRYRQSAENRGRQVPQAGKRGRVRQPRENGITQCKSRSTYRQSAEKRKSHIGKARKNAKAAAQSIRKAKKNKNHR